MKIELIKSILEKFKYDSIPKGEHKDSIKDFKVIANSFDYESGDLLQEETFDDFDTVYEALRIGLEMEIKDFISQLLVNNVESFAWAFVEPSTEIFKDAWGHVLNKFTLRDQASRDQFLERIKILLRNIFIDKIGIKDEQLAINLADAYYEVFRISINQILDKMKPTEGSTTDIAQNFKDEQGNELTYR